MNCPDCATELPEGARFCGGCGRRFQAPAGGEPAPASPSSSQVIGLQVLNIASSQPPSGAPSPTSAPPRRITTPAEPAPARFDLVADDFARALERACARAGLPVPPGPAPSDHATLFRAAEAAGLPKLDIEKALHLVSLEKLPASARKAMGVVLEDDLPQGRPLWLPLVVAINIVALLVGIGAYLLYDPAPSGPPLALKPQRGEIDRLALQATLAGLTKTTERCYRETLQQHPTLAGGLVLTLRIGLDGRAEARLAEDELGNAAASACILGAARAATYPAARGAPVEIDVPLTFDARKDG